MSEALSAQSNAIFNNERLTIYKRIDRMFAVLMLVQWLLAIVFAVFLAPLSWDGSQSQIHFHIYAAVFIGGLLALFPVGLVIYQPGAALNRHVIAISQMAFSGLLIHLDNGRIESHFHVFGSLAFLAMYRDWSILLTASMVTGLDHLFRGIFWPQSIYGVLTASPWRAIEHAAWVIFEDVFLIYSIRTTIKDMRAAAHNSAHLEQTLHNIEIVVRARTAQLLESKKVIEDQQNSLVISAKHSALGEMAGQIAHEINTPLGAIVLTAQSLRKKTTNSPVDATEVNSKMDFILQITTKLSRIIQSMRKLAGQGANEQMNQVRIKDFLEETLLLCEGRFKKHGIDFTFKNHAPDGTTVQCRSNEVAQVVVNVLNNAADAVAGAEDKRVDLSALVLEGNLLLKVTDSGPGVAQEHRDKIFLPQFSTKSLDHGTGFGLAICKRLVDQHRGRIYLEPGTPTTFVIQIPLEQPEAIALGAAG